MTESVGDWMSVREFAAAFEVDETTVYRQVKAGGGALPVPFLRVGSLIRFPRARVMAVRSEMLGLAAIEPAPSSAVLDSPSAAVEPGPPAEVPAERVAS